MPKTLDPEWNVIWSTPVNGVEELLLDVVCWDKDRFGKDYMGEFDLALEEIFTGEQTATEPTWYPLKSKRGKRGKKEHVSGEVLLQCTLFDPNDKDATSAQILDKLRALAGTVDSRNTTPTRTPILGPSATYRSDSSLSPQSPPSGTDGSQDDDDDDDELDDEETPPEDEDPTKPEAIEKRKRRLRIKGLKRKRRENPYSFINCGSDVVGLVFLEVVNITDLPPESNFTRTSFDMDPFVVVSLGKKTYRTKHIRHNLNPVFNEKMLFQLLGHEQTYSFSFTVIDRDKYSANDFVASASLPLKELLERAPRADPKTGLYELQEAHEYEPAKKSRLSRLGLSRSPSQQSMTKSRPPMSKSPSASSNLSATGGAERAPSPEPSSLPDVVPKLNVSGDSDEAGEMGAQDPSFTSFTIPLKMKNMEKWEDKHNPQLFIRAKYMPYPALRQQFWRAMLRQYDTDESGEISKVELTTMLDTLGSTLRESTIDSFFQRFPHKAADGDEGDLTFDEAVICLEDQVQGGRAKAASVADKVKNMLHVPTHDSPSSSSSSSSSNNSLTPTETPANEMSSLSLNAKSSDNTDAPVSTVSVPDLNTPGEEGEMLEKDDLNVDRTDEHVVEIRQCPICHQPRLNKRRDADIITHIATCASQDWRQVDSLMMGGFVTASQAQRKWYSKVITKISYGGYKLGANSANILVQDRITGQINEEKMSVYVRLGIRLLYKGLKSRDMENKRSKSAPDAAMAQRSS